MGGLRHSVGLGKVAGISVGAHWSLPLAWLFVVAGLGPSLAAGTGSPVLGYGLAVVMAVALSASVLAHELGHCLVARSLGVGVERVTLWMLGGLAEIAARMPSGPGTVAVAVAGPAVSAALCVGSGGAALALGSGVAASCAWWLCWINGVLAVFNLLPGSPLDGGRVVAGALWWIGGSRARGELRAAQVGQGLAAVLGGLGVWQLAAGSGGLWTLLLAWFIWGGARREASLARLELAAAGHTVGEVCEPLGPPVAAGVTVHGLASMGVVRPCVVLGSGERLLDPGRLVGASPTATAGDLAVDVSRRWVAADAALDAALEELAQLPPGPVGVRDTGGALVGVVSLRRLWDLAGSRRG